MKNSTISIASLILLSFSITSSCSVNFFKKKSIKSSDLIIISYISDIPDYHYIVHCNELNKMSTFKTYTIKDRNEIMQFDSVFNNPANFSIDTNSSEIDVRIHIEVFHNNSMVKSYCIESGNRVYVNDKYLKYGKPVKEYLIKKKFLDFYYYN